MKLLQYITQIIWKQFISYKIIIFFLLNPYFSFFGVFWFWGVFFADATGIATSPLVRLHSLFLTYLGICLGLILQWIVWLHLPSHLSLCSEAEYALCF